MGAKPNCNSYKKIDDNLPDFRDRLDPHRVLLNHDTQRVLGP
ncbi:hypothetical protein [Mycobacterium sp.]|nr:hypothetical protein [Mycobacterium sp.]